jgi:hypothetical protein
MPRQYTQQQIESSLSHADPIKVRIFRSGLVVGASLTMFINGWLFVTQVYYIPSFFQLAYGLSAVRSGALLLPITLTQTLSSTFSGLIVHWTGRYRESIILGWAAWAIGLGCYSTLDPQHFDLGKAIGYGLLTGFGVGQTLQPSLIAIQAGVARQDMAVVTCTRNLCGIWARRWGWLFRLRWSILPCGLLWRARVSLVRISSMILRLFLGRWLMATNAVRLSSWLLRLTLPDSGACSISTLLWRLLVACWRSGLFRRLGLRGRMTVRCARNLRRTEVTSRDRELLEWTRC